MLIVPRPPIESDLSSESGVHIHLAREDHRVRWLTQGETEGHRKDEEEGLRGGRPFMILEVERGKSCLSHSVAHLGLLPSIYPNIYFF